MNLEKLVFITCHHDFVESAPFSVIAAESRQLLLMNHWNVLEKLFVFYVCNLQVNYAATKSTGKTTGSLLWGRTKNRKANRDTIVVEAVDVTQIFFATECAQLVVDVIA